MDSQSGCLHCKKAASRAAYAEMSLFKKLPAELRYVNMSLQHCVSQYVFSLQRAASRAVRAQMSVLPFTSQASCTERKAPPSSLTWDKITTVISQAECTIKKTLAEPFAQRCVYCSVPVELCALKGLSAKQFALLWFYYCVPAELFATKETVQPSCLPCRVSAEKWVY
jgi:hypothetical protein